MHLKILKKEVLKEIPSASGVEIHKNEYYMVGDNSPWLFKVDSQYKVLEKIAINSSPNDEIEKKDKPDFEAMTMIKNKGKDELLIFGSGSKIPVRDGLVRITLSAGPEVNHFSLSKLYAKIRKESDIKSKTFNIEAAASNDKNLYLFNRGKNRIIVFKLKEFIKYIEGSKSVPSPQIFKIRLPSLNKIKAGLSGASITPDQKKIIFTASVENTSNTYDDGEILGSYVGVFPLKKLGKSKNPDYILIKENDEILKIKVESVAISHIDNNGIHLKMVTDSDGKASEIIEAVLTLKHKKLI